jgi:hypothetical protein
MNSQQQKQTITVSFVPIALVFVVLKVAGVISWSWLWVLSPLWIPATIILTVCAIVFFVAFVLS